MLIYIITTINGCFAGSFVKLKEMFTLPEKWWLEDYFPIGKVTFQGLC